MCIRDRLSAPTKGSLTPAAPIYYRKIQVGQLLSVGLASDGNSVEARAYIEPAYAPLVREGTRFWSASGIDAQIDLRGLRLKTESLQALVMGGIALATPADGGAQVGTGHRFELHDGPEDEWLQWQASIPVGSALLPPGASLPRPMRASLSWSEGRILTDTEEHQGWVLNVSRGLLGPVDLGHGSRSQRAWES